MRIFSKPLPIARRTCMAGLAVWAMAWPTLAMADCVNSERKASAAEQDFYNRAIAAAMAALPPAPPGVKLEGQVYDFKQLPAIGLLCAEQKTGDFAVNVLQRYFLALGDDELKARHAERKSLRDQLDALLLLPPEQNAQKQALQKQEEAARSAAYVARKAGDLAGAKAREAESEALYRQIDDLRHKHAANVKPQQDDLSKRFDAIDIEGLRATVGVAFNMAKLPAASQTVGAFGVASPGRSAGLKVTNVVWQVGGPETALRQSLLAALDRPRLQALVGKALPSVGDSETHAGKATPPALALQAPLAAPAPAAKAATSPSVPPPVAAAPVPASAQPAIPTLPVPDAAASVKEAADAVNKLRNLFGR